MKENETNKHPLSSNFMLKVLILKKSWGNLPFLTGIYYLSSIYIQYLDNFCL